MRAAPSGVSPARSAGRQSLGGGSRERLSPVVISAQLHFSFLFPVFMTPLGRGTPQSPAPCISASISAPMPSNSKLSLKMPAASREPCREIRLGFRRPMSPFAHYNRARFTGAQGSGASGCAGPRSQASVFANCFGATPRAALKRNTERLGRPVSTARATGPDDLMRPAPASSRRRSGETLRGAEPGPRPPNRRVKGARGLCDGLGGRERGSRPARLGDPLWQILNPRSS